MKEGALKRTAEVALRITSGVAGYDPMRTWSAVRGVARYIKTAQQYASRDARSSLRLTLRNLYPICADFDADAGTASGHYFHQDLWAARKIHGRRPERHVDIGSRIDGFIAHLLVFMPVDVVDVRPLQSPVPGLHFVQSDAVALEQFDTNSLDSISSLHAVEHFGLGRYGDAVDPNACFVAMASLARVLKVGGRLYFSVPIGCERVEFNAHRVFAPQTILQQFRELSLVSFAAVDDAGNYCEGRPPEDFRGARFACGLYEFTKNSG